MGLDYKVKLGNVGDFHVGLEGGKLVLGIDGDLDLQAQLDKLLVAHQTGVLGTVLKLADDGLKAYVAANPAPPAA